MFKHQIIKSVCKQINLHQLAAVLLETVQSGAKRVFDSMTNND